MSNVDVAAIREALAKSCETFDSWAIETNANGTPIVQAHYVDDPAAKGTVARVYTPADVELIVLLRNNAEALLEALERAQAASEGVDMLIAQAERRGAVKALRASADWFVARNTYGPLGASDWLLDRADAIETGSDL